MVLSKLSVPRRPTIWITVGQGPTALAVGAGGGCLDIFTLSYPFFPLSPSLWEPARYRLKYCLPLINYGSITLGSTSKANVERLTKLQKRAAKIILKTNIITPSFHMFRELKWSSIDDRVKYNKTVFAYKALNDLTPSYISSLLKQMSEIHALNLGSSDNGTLHIPFTRAELYIGSFSCSAPSYGMLFLKQSEIPTPSLLLKRESKQYFCTSIFQIRFKHVYMQ